MAEINRIEEDMLMYALHSIATQTEEVETARIALIALYETDKGRAFLKANPIRI